MISDCTAVILTGGESRRMGQDKASLMLGEHSLLERAIQIVQPLFNEILVSVRQAREEIIWPQVCDDTEHHGPLAGLAAGLKQANTPWIFVLACDMPYINIIIINLLSKYRDDYQAVVPVANGHPQPLCAFYARDCLDEVLSCLNGDGKHSLRELLTRLRVCYVGEEEIKLFDPQLHSFFDLDTPRDVICAEGALRIHNDEFSMPFTLSCVAGEMM